MSAIRSYNKVILVGNLTRDPEIKELESGSKICIFGIATNFSWKGKDGERKTGVEFHTIVAWNRLAEICAQLLKTGMLVFVDGEIRTRSWEDESKEIHQKKEIRANDVKLLNDKGKSGVAAFTVGGEEEVKKPKKSKKAKEE